MFLFLEADFFARLSHPTCCDFCYHHDYKVCIENSSFEFNSLKCVENLETHKVTLFKFFGLNVIIEIRIERKSGKIDKNVS